jgi:hypothetical protein
MPPAYYPRPDYLRDTGYYPAQSSNLDVVTLALGLIALLAVLGMVFMWILVFQAY